MLSRRTQNAMTVLTLDDEDGSNLAQTEIIANPIVTSDSDSAILEKVSSAQRFRTSSGVPFEVFPDFD